MRGELHAARSDLAVALEHLTSLVPFTTLEGCRRLLPVVIGVLSEASAGRKESELQERALLDVDVKEMLLCLERRRDEKACQAGAAEVPAVVSRAGEPSAAVATHHAVSGRARRAKAARARTWRTEDDDAEYDEEPRKRRRSRLPVKKTQPGQGEHAIVLEDAWPGEACPKIVAVSAWKEEALSVIAKQGGKGHFHSKRFRLTTLELHAVEGWIDDGARSLFAESLRKALAARFGSALPVGLSQILMQARWAHGVLKDMPLAPATPEDVQERQLLPAAPELASNESPEFELFSEPSFVLDDLLDDGYVLQ